MTADYEYSRGNRENLPFQIQIKLSKKPLIFCGTFYAVLKSTFNFQCCEKKMSLIGPVILKILTPKDVLILMHNRACFWKPFGSERFNELRKLLQFAEKYFYPFFSSFSAKITQKKLFLIRSEILGLLVNTLIANYEYSRSNRENLALPIQIKLSKKP